jgi:hypothetical protein
MDADDRSKHVFRGQGFDQPIHAFLMTAHCFGLWKEYFRLISWSIQAATSGASSLNRLYRRSSRLRFKAVNALTSHTNGNKTASKGKEIRVRSFMAPLRIARHCWVLCQRTRKGNRNLLRNAQCFQPCGAYMPLSREALFREVSTLWGFAPPRAVDNGEDTSTTFGVGTFVMHCI